MVFELLTGEYLFEPKCGNGYTKEDDHLCQMIELLGPIPKSLRKGKRANKFFNQAGKMLHIAASDMKEWPLYPVLVVCFSSFIIHPCSCVSCHLLLLLLDRKNTSIPKRMQER